MCIDYYCCICVIKCFECFEVYVSCGVGYENVISVGRFRVEVRDDVALGRFGVEVWRFELFL